MLDYKHRQHRHGRPQKFLQGGQSRYFAFRFQVADHTMQMDVNKTLCPFYRHKENAPCCGNSPTNALRWQQYLFSHCIKLRDLLLSAVIVSLH